MSFHGQVGRVRYWSNFYQSSGYSDDVYYDWGLPYVYEVTMFILRRNSYTYLKVSN